ncbi:MAG: 30S ribosomal protein S25e [Candidatus Nezhaarchaeota archaeon]|nr:30S ribosomal protein S25e [Candidatus Nezhaarchaeota archaeon]MCX8141393.1 30S ribosomal protein S25e [Candidatus Nezhaarchaeota archaeon]MDW8049659.1 30S ribosomal protein S25e [Nitrososphaerota archaeon]
MGGKKKKSISAMEKQQKLREVKEKKVKEEKEERREKKEKKIASPLLPLEVAKQLEKELSSLTCITPYTLATKFGLKLGVAKNVLKELELKGLLRNVAKCSRISIYTPIRSPSSTS